MDSVKKYLSSQEGVKLIWPPFKKYDHTCGLISRYNTGRKENGIFLHAVSWAIIAEAMLNRPQSAFSYYKNALPLKYNDSAEILKTEPYVYCQTVCSDDALNRGEGANSWLTGTASWMYIAATQYILGIKPTPEGLTVTPCIPTSWEGFRAKRHYRGCLYDITVRKGAEYKITLNGQTLKNRVIPPQKTQSARVSVETV